MVSYFIDENVKASQVMSESTTQFLDSQLRNAAGVAGPAGRTGCVNSGKSTQANCRSRCRPTSRC